MSTDRFTVGGGLTDATPPDDYALGHSDDELQRLMWQAEVLRPYAEQLLRMAGIGPGMRVLDIGCGTGDMAMLAAGRVGPSGSVTGIDRSERPLAVAARRAELAGLPWARFQHAALEEFTATEPFDAVIGRYVLIHQTDPVGFLSEAGRHVAVGGVLAFHEMNAARPTVICPEVPLWQQADQWAKRALSSVSPSMDAGSLLIEHFAAAGLPEPELHGEVPVGGGRGSHLYRYMAETIRSLLPVLGGLGVPAEVVGIDTLEERLRAAVTHAKAQIEWNPQFLAISRR
jgi:ubiquinone/menaquinone biosynthesis C-methylase UbiE